MLFCVEPDGRTHLAASDLGFPNGMAITPDGKTLIVAETTANRISAFSISHGALRERRTWAKFGEPPSSTNVGEMLGELAMVPDGICLDAEGAVWIADVKGGRLLRVAEGGRILEDLPAGGPVFACMLGGEDGRTLFACQAPTYDEMACSVNHRASVIMTQVEVARAGWP